MKEYDETNRKTLIEELETSIELKNLDSNQSQTSIHEEKEISRNSQILGDNKEFEKQESLLIDVEKKNGKIDNTIYNKRLFNDNVFITFFFSKF